MEERLKGVGKLILSCLLISPAYSAYSRALKEPQMLSFVETQ